MTEEWARSPRGFHLAELPFTDYVGNVPRTMQVQESSLASEDKLWVGPDTTLVTPTGPSDAYISERMHLGVDEVRWLRDRLSEWLDGVDAEAKEG